MNREYGNAFVITLVSVILLGALTFVTMRQMGASSVETLSDEKAEIYANQLIGQANAFRAVVQQMLETGNTIDDLNFVRPDEASFATGITRRKVYHPTGGGLNVPPLNVAMQQSNYQGLPDWGWRVQYGYNVEWTETAATDVLYSFVGLKPEICAKINKILTGSETIPQELSNAGGSFGNLFTHGGTDTDFLASDCPSCDGKPMLCVGKGSGNLTDYVFYVVAAQR